MPLVTTKALLRRFPPLERWARRLDRRTRHRVEKQLIRGVHSAGSRHPSILHFSFNKSATQYVKSILVRCARANGLVHVGLHEYAFDTDFPFLDRLSAEEMKGYRHLFRERGYLYSAFGGMIEGIPDLDAYKVVLVARDPRDLLVSGYYSILHSHPEPDARGTKHEAFVRRREAARSATIDEFVLQDSERQLAAFRRYESALLATHPDVFFTTYEQMVGDFERWLDALLGYCELPIDPQLRARLLREHEASRPREENVKRHLRKGVPGDHREKLKPETIEILNERFASVLQAFGYGEGR